MGEFDIRALSPAPETIEAAHRIALPSFGNRYLEEGRLLRQWESSEPKSTFAGAFDGDRLVAFMGFRPHAAWLGSDSCTVFQAMHGATHPDFRGRGLFTKLARWGIESLEGDFLIGYPNDQALPIWRDRLGFAAVPQVRVWIPARLPVPVIDRAKLEAQLSNGLLCRIDARAAADIKKKEKVHAIVEHESEGNYLWGRLRERKIGPVMLRFFDVGGYEIADPRRINATVASVSRRVQTSAVRFICTETSPIAKAARRVWIIRDNVLVWAPLRSNGGCRRLDLFQGVADTW